MDIKYLFKEYLDLAKKSIIYNKNLIIFSAILFFIPMLLAHFFQNEFHPVLNPVVEKFRKSITPELLTTKNLFVNNTKVLLILFSGGLSLGIIPAFILIYNGLILGYASMYVPSVFDYVLLIAPHGVFELVAIFFGAAAGFRISIFIFKLIWSLFSSKKLKQEIISQNLLEDDNFIKNNSSYLKDNYSTDRLNFFELINLIISTFKKDLVSSVMLLISGIFLLVIAAFVEANITIPLYRTIISFL